jgi:hypothetical protein
MSGSASFPEGEKILIGAAGFGSVDLHGVSARDRGEQVVPMESSVVVQFEIHRGSNGDSTCGKLGA